MDEIYPILAKHFLKEASVDEENQVLKYKVANPKEYVLLQELWNKQNVQVRAFDSQKAWQELLEKREKKSSKVIPLFGNLRRIAAAAAILAATSFMALYLSSKFSNSDLVVVENTGTTIVQKELGDGSVVWLNRGATISYPKEFGDVTRDISLEGEAYFEVKKDAQHPFMVSADYSTISVLGTSFNIDTDASRTFVTVRTGKVEVALTSKEEKAILLPDQTALATKNELLTANKTESNYLSWKTGVFEFADTPLAQVVAQLNTYYEDSMVLDSSKKYNCSLSAKFNQAPLEEILEIIEVTCGLNVKKMENRYSIE